MSWTGVTIRAMTALELCNECECHDAGQGVTSHVAESYLEEVLSSGARRYLSQDSDDITAIGAVMGLDGAGIAERFGADGGSRLNVVRDSDGDLDTSDGRDDQAPDAAGGESGEGDDTDEDDDDEDDDDEDEDESDEEAEADDTESERAEIDLEIMVLNFGLDQVGAR